MYRQIWKNVTLGVLGETTTIRVKVKINTKIILLIIPKQIKARKKITDIIK